MERDPPAARYHDDAGNSSCAAGTEHLRQHPQQCHVSMSRWGLPDAPLKWSVSIIRKIYILYTTYFKVKIWQRSSSTTYIYWYTLFHLYSWGSMSRFPLSSRSQEMCSFREMELWHSAVSKDCQTKQIVQSSIKSSCGFFEFYYNQDSSAKSQNCNLAPH